MEASYTIVKDYLFCPAVGETAKMECQGQLFGQMIKGQVVSCGRLPECAAKDNPYCKIGKLVEFKVAANAEVRPNDAEGSGKMAI